MRNLCGLIVREERSASHAFTDTSTTSRPSFRLLCFAQVFKSESSWAMNSKVFLFRRGSSIDAICLRIFFFVVIGAEFL